MIPAFELFVLFGVQAGLVAAGVTSYRWFTRRGKNRLQRRFSLRSALLLVAVAAFVSAVAVRLPEVTWPAWLMVVWMGVLAGAQTLLAAWLVAGKTRWWIRLPIVAALPGVVLLMLLAAFDAAVNSSPNVNGISVPPIPLGEHVSSLLGIELFGFIAFEEGPESFLLKRGLKFFVCVAIVALTSLLCALFVGAWPKSRGFFTEFSG